MFWRIPDTQLSFGDQRQYSEGCQILSCHFVTRDNVPKNARYSAVIWWPETMFWKMPDTQLSSDDQRQCSEGCQILNCHLVTSDNVPKDARYSTVIWWPETMFPRMPVTQLSFGDQKQCSKGWRQIQSRRFSWMGANVLANARFSLCGCHKCDIL